MARKNKNESESASLASMGLENFTISEVSRSDLKGAPYNPRKISEAEKRKLREGLKRHGLVAPITWNRRTGNVVGGHQRLAQLDKLAGTSNYTLHVAEIDVDESREKELNVLLNNPNAQGDWDMELLKDIFDDKSVDLSGMGFDAADLYQLFGDDISQQQEPEVLDELAQKVRDFANKYDEIRAKNCKSQSDEYYMVVVFKDDTDLQDFLAEGGLPMNRYQSGAELRRLCGFGECE
jgi:hypothetical protein